MLKESRETFDTHSRKRRRLPIVLFQSTEFSFPEDTGRRFACPVPTNYAPSGRIIFPPSLRFVRLRKEPCFRNPMRSEQRERSLGNRTKQNRAATPRRGAIRQRRESKQCERNLTSRNHKTAPRRKHRCAPDVPAAQWNNQRLKLRA